MFSVAAAVVTEILAKFQSDIRDGGVVKWILIYVVSCG
jgi:hypothetical protein